MKKTTTVNIEIKSSTTAKELAAALEEIPGHAKPSLYILKADPPYAGDTQRIDFTWTDEDTKSENDSQCVFDVSWVGRCKKPTLEGTDFCDKHFGKRCVVCQKQATRDCEATVGAFVCGSPLCNKHHDVHWL